MGLLGWGLFGALFGIADEINTRKDIKNERAESAKRCADFKRRMDQWEELRTKNYLALPDKNDIISHVFCIEATQISAEQFLIRWNCDIDFNSIATEFVIYKNYKNQPPQKIATLPFIRFNRIYEYTDTISPSEPPCISYSVYLYGTYEGTLIKSHSSTGGRLVPKLKKIDLHVESRNNESAKLFWNRQPNVSNYKVYRSRIDQNEEDFIPVVILEGDARRYTDHNVNVGKTYTYFIQAIRTQNGFLLDEITSNKQNVTIEKSEEPQTKTKIGNIPSTKQKHHDFDNMDGHEFESFCATLLKRNGFKNVSVTKGSGDQGIDILATKDGIKYGIQCKCYSSEVGNKAVQEAFSGKTFYNRHVGVVLTNNFFTTAAKELAEKNGIILWDRKRLLKMIEFSSHNCECEDNK